MMERRVRIGSLLLLVVTLTNHFDCTKGVQLECSEGWILKDYKCYKLFSDKSLQDATQICESYGAKLATVFGYESNLEVGEIAASATQYWIGSSDDRAEAFWSSARPEDVGECVSVRVDSEEFYVLAWTKTACSTPLPFVCEIAAQVPGLFHCLNGLSIPMALKCDGENDCKDFTDEIDCASRCKILQTGESGDFRSESSPYKANSDCRWVIEGPPGSKITLTISAFDTETDKDEVEVWVGGRTDSTAELVARLSGTNLPIPITIRSPNHLMVIIFLSDSTVQKTGFSAKWIAETGVTGGDIKLKATADTQYLQSPSFPEFVPSSLRETWIITAGLRQVISLQVETFELAADSYLLVRDGATADGRVLHRIDGGATGYPPVIISASSTVNVYLYTSNEYPGKGIKLSYKQGCGGSIKASGAEIISPGFPDVKYPNSQICTWVLATIPDSQPGTLIINEMQLAAGDDDKLQVYDGVDAATGKLLATLTSSNPPSEPFASPTGELVVVFTTSAAYTSKGFQASFSIGCVDPQFNDKTVVSPAISVPLPLNSQLSVSCQENYYFAQKAYSGKMSVTITCKSTGWDVAQLPDCQPKYCGQANLIPFGYIKSSTGARHGDTLTYSCYAGYKASFYTINCIGTDWEAAPECKATECVPAPVLGSASSKFRAGTGTEYATVIEYTCDKGYEISGPPIIICREDGEWSNETMICNRIACPLPECIHCNLSDTSAVLDGVLDVECHDGYIIDGEARITCQDDQTFNAKPACKDKDECATGNGGCKNNCTNTEGSFVCSCNKGYIVSNSDSTVCEDINECEKNNAGCDQKCTNIDASYTCSCNETGYSLFTAEGDENTTGKGEWPGDKLLLDHSCIKKSCPKLTSPENGILLTVISTFRFGDEAYFKCLDGFVMIGEGKLTCGDNKAWSASSPTCVVATCEVPELSSIESAYRPTTMDPAAGSSVKVGLFVKVTCSQFRPTPLETSRECVYDPVSKSYTFGNVSEFTCTVIDCGVREDFSGGDITDVVPGNFYGAKFKVKCKPDFQLDGGTNHTDGEDVVECNADAHWMYGSIMCEGASCDDPGTPPDAVQVGTSYQDGKKVTYTCNRDGFEPDNKNPKTCEVSTWDNINVPNCIDVVKPNFTECPTDMVIDKLTSANYKLPVATDNSNLIKSLTVTPTGFGPFVVITTTTTVTYTATDYKDLTATCSFEIKVRDDVLPTITCPSAVTHTLSSNVSEAVTYPTITPTSVGGVTPTVTYDPATLEVGPEDIGKSFVITATATDPDGNKASCPFMIFVKAEKCKDYAIKAPLHGQKDCVRETGGWTCAMSCDKDFLFYEKPEQKSVTFSCSDGADWTPVGRVPDCLSTSTKADTFVSGKFTFTSTADIPTDSSCDEYYKNEIVRVAGTGSVEFLTKQCTDSKRFGVNKVEVSSSPDRLAVEQNSATEILITYSYRVIAVGDGSLSAGCGLYIGTFYFSSPSTDDDLVEFIDKLPANANCPALTTKVAKFISTDLDCNKNLKLYSDVCLPCPFGMELVDNKCTECPIGSYTEKAGDACQPCGTGKTTLLTGSGSASECVDMCTKWHMKSASGLPPCEPCPVNQYLGDSKTCTPCPVDTATDGPGMWLSSQCKVVCVKGEYSKSGYAPCKKCPQHFYQDRTKSKSCLEADVGQGTTTAGADSSALNAVVCGDCSNNGECAIPLHTPICTCNEGYEGESCEKRINFCLSTPCYNDGTCKLIAGGYECTCPTGFSGDNCETDPDNCVGKPCKNGGKCRDLPNAYECICLPGFDDINCDTESNICEPNPCKNGGKCNLLSTERYECICEAGYSGVLCDTDINDCASGPCRYGSECKDGVNTFTCNCDTTVSTGTLCETRVDSCASSSCRDTATCHAFADNVAVCLCKPGYEPGVSSNNKSWVEDFPDVSLDQCVKVDHCKTKPCKNGACTSTTVGYKCDCADGYDGDNCQHNIDECIDEPCEHGRCEDGVGTFKCYCESAYEGETCSTLRVHCAQNNPCQPKGVDTLKGTKGCEELVGDYKCICKTGYDGKHCENNINDCASEPCRHGGTCTDGVNEYTCACVDGWIGDRCEKIRDNCQVDSCQQGSKCLSVFPGVSCRCEPLTYGDKCDKKASTCHSEYPCVGNGSVCTEEEGTASCLCSAEYTGDGCQLKVSFCEGDGICTNGGTCKELLNDFECICLEEFEGKRCEKSKRACTDTTCSAGLCVDSIDGFHCECNIGKEGPTCSKDVDHDFDLYFQNAEQTGRAAAGFAFELGGGSLTVGLWIRLTRSSATFFTLYGLNERSLTNPHIELVRLDPSQAVVSISGTSMTVPYAEYARLDKQDAPNWSYLQLTWSGSVLTIRINSALIAEEKLVSAQPLAKYGWVVLGCEYDPTTRSCVANRGLSGLLSHVNVWRSAVLAASDIQELASDPKALVATDKLAASWTGYLNDGGVEWLRPSTAGTKCADGFIGATCEIKAADRAGVTIKCPEHVHVLGPSRHTKVTWDSPVVTGTKNTPTSTYTSGQVLSWGRYANVYTVTDDSGTSASCGFYIFVRIKAVCVEPEVSGKLEAACDIGTTWPFYHCKLSCTGENAFSIPVPERYTCGPMGTFSVKNKFLPMHSPQCARKQVSRSSVSIKIIYHDIKPCASAKRDFKEHIYKWLEGIDDKWVLGSTTSPQQRLCGGKRCVDVFVIVVTCPEDKRRRRRRATEETVVTVTTDDVPEQLTTNDGSISNTQDVLLASALDDEALDFSLIIPSAVSINDLLEITLEASCQPGQQLIAGACVDCALGTFYDAANSSCKSCAIATYGESLNITSCSPCAAGKTTMHTGSTSSADCEDACVVGHFFDTSACAPCLYGFYQDEPAQFYCKPCSVNTNTSATGTVDASLCIEVCLDGMEIGQELVCINCSRGTYRKIGVDVKCVNCSKDFTTRYERAVTTAECDLPDCQPGTHIDGMACTPCPIGTYQPESWQVSCLNCTPTGYTTLQTNSKNLTDCKFACPAGQEKDPGKADTCLPCPLGKYKVLTSPEACTDCDVDRTTLEEGSIAETNCSIKKCSEGKEPNADQTACGPCQQGFYQPLAYQPKCLQCDADTSTKLTGTILKADCIAYCPNGKENDPATSTCIDCQLGYYRNITDGPFDPCQICPENFITVAKGSVSPDQCTLANCSAGWYRDAATNACVACEKGSYQPEKWQTMCIPCQTEKTTADVGATSQDECAVHCDPGKEDREDVCAPCLVGFYKSVAGPDACTACPPDLITATTGATAQDNCSVADCAAGQYLNTTGNSCSPCPLGEYQAEARQTSCTACDAGLTTLALAQTEKTACVTDCPDGRGLTAGACDDCEIGYYRQRGSEPLCTICANGLITLATATVTSDFCEVANCSAGEYKVKVDSCEACPRGEYQPQRWQTSCLKCDADKTTPAEGSTSADDCTTNCPSGFELVSDVCEKCQRGYYKDVTKHFNCEMCDPTKITPFTGSTSESECKLGNCTAGQRIVGGGCETCPVGSYNTAKWQTACVSCGDKMTTGGAGATTAADCFSTDMCSFANNTCVAAASGGSCANVLTPPGFVCGCRGGWIADGDACVHKCDASYCKNGATCERGDIENPRCVCTEEYEGDDCGSRIDKKSMVPYIIGGSIGGFVLFILVLLLAVGLCWYCRIPSGPKPQVVPYMNPAYTPMPRVVKPPIRYNGTPPRSVFNPQTGSQMSGPPARSTEGYNQQNYMFYQDADTPINGAHSYNNRAFEDKVTAMNIA